jgi:hypothetical protein
MPPAETEISSASKERSNMDGEKLSPPNVTESCRIPVIDIGFFIKSGRVTKITGLL